jgi:hypothetical protein
LQRLENRFEQISQNIIDRADKIDERQKERAQRRRNRRIRP